MLWLASCKLHPYYFLVLYFVHFKYAGYTGEHIGKYSDRTQTNIGVTNKIPEGKQEIDTFGDTRSQSKPQGTTDEPASRHGTYVDEEGTSYKRENTYGT